MMPTFPALPELGTTLPRQSITLFGSGVFQGLALGTAHPIPRGLPEVPEYPIALGYIGVEEQRFSHALERTIAQLQRLKEKLGPHDRQRELVHILEAHGAILRDPAFTNGVLVHVHERCNAEWAVKRHLDELLAMFQAVDDPYLREKGRDLFEVSARLLANLSDPQRDRPVSFSQPVILVAENFSPADMLLLDRRSILGFVTEQGGPTSHTAIMARALNLPAVVGVSDALEQIKAGDTLAVDGISGCVVIRPDERTLREFERRKRRLIEVYTSLLAERRSPHVTRDGHSVHLMVNLEFQGDAVQAAEINPHGVGLFRSETLFFGRNEPPDEEEQYQHYRRIIEAMGDRPVTLRTLDLGGDKGTPALPVTTLSDGTNPSMGLQGIRFCLHRGLQVFRTQLRALLRAAHNSRARLLVPMVSSPREIIAARRELALAAAELSRRGIPHHPQPPLGAMVEVPAAALCAELLAREADFLAIGSNDLIQFTLAADRVNKSVAYLYNPLHPAVLHLIHRTVQGAHRLNRTVSLCGEMAGDPYHTLLLVGLGLDELSMTPGCLPTIRKILSSITWEQAQDIARRVLDMDDPETMAALLEETTRQLVDHRYLPAPGGFLGGPPHGTP
ncbi:MAG: phosphoenolpyruvate--protein phosphotransferase [Magnetococcus sp. WYHC-3]